MIASGFYFFQENLKIFFSENFLNNLNQLLLKIPFFTISQALFLGKTDQFSFTHTAWWLIVVALPLVILGLVLIVNRLSVLSLSIFNLTYSQTHCPFCKKPIKIMNGKTWEKFSQDSLKSNREGGDTEGNLPAH